MTGEPAKTAERSATVAVADAGGPVVAGRRLLRRLWVSPDPDLVDAGQRGEWILAGIRLLLVVALFYVPLRAYLDAPGTHGATLVLWVAVAVVAEALVIYSAVKRSWGRRWIGFFSGILDVTLVSLILWLRIVLGDPLGATNDLIFFPIYLLAIGATCLRYDWRICALTGAAAILQYYGLMRYTVWQWDLASARPLVDATFGWGQQYGRLAVLALATILSTAIVSRAREQRRLSTRDRLTNLANRGFFDDSLSRIGAVAARAGEPVAVAMIDVDHFKRFNDAYGHAAGDEALRIVARVLAASFRTTDLVARYGGEEFVGLFPGMRLRDACRRLEEVRLAVAQTPVGSDFRGQRGHVTVSIGSAVWPDDAMSLEKTIELADRRLYRAKADGRNRLVTGEPSESGIMVDTAEPEASDAVASEKEE